MRFLVSFCICTYNREEGLHTLLNSIQKINLNDAINEKNVQVIIVDNFNGKSNKIINSIKKFKFKFKWYHEKRQGLSNARNKTVELSNDSEFCLFVDDDQKIDKNCLLELFKTQKKYDADVVYGSNPPIYDITPSNYIDYFFKAKFKKKYDYKIRVAPTNCTLIKKETLNNIDGPFNILFNQTGGEDSFLTRGLHLKGAKMYRSVKAKAFEIIPKSR